MHSSSGCAPPPTNAGVRFVLSFGESAEADAILHSCALGVRVSRVKARVLGQELDYVIGAPGRHIAMNSLAVLLAARAAGLDLAAAAGALPILRRRPDAASALER